MDLDDEELKATRRMNGSDKNVGSIEGDIKILEEFIEDSKDYIHYSITGDELGAIGHLIKAYKELKERLKIKKNTPEWEYQYWEARKEVDNEWTSKIKEKIEELEKQYEFYNSDKRETKNIAKGYYIAIQKLEELLEKE